MQKYVATSLLKSWFFLFIIGLLLTLAACGNSAPTTNTNTPTATTAPTATAVPTEAPTPTATTAPTTAPSSGNAITVSNFSFTPATLTVKAGTTVTWTNQDSVAHTATSDNGAFGGALPPGGSYSFTFKTPGTYTYHCRIHPGMTATIIVQ